MTDCSVIKNSHLRYVAEKEVFVITCKLDTGERVWFQKVVQVVDCRAMVFFGLDEPIVIYRAIQTSGGIGE